MALRSKKTGKKERSVLRKIFECLEEGDSHKQGLPSSSRIEIAYALVDALAALFGEILGSGTRAALFQLGNGMIISTALSVLAVILPFTPSPVGGTQINRVPPPISLESLKPAAGGIDWKPGGEKLVMGSQVFQRGSDSGRGIFFNDHMWAVYDLNKKYVDLVFAVGFETGRRADDKKPRLLVTVDGDVTEDREIDTRSKPFRIVVPVKGRRSLRIDLIDGAAIGEPMLYFTRYVTLVPKPTDPSATDSTAVNEKWWPSLRTVRPNSDGRQFLVRPRMPSSCFLSELPRKKLSRECGQQVAGKDPKLTFPYPACQQVDTNGKSKRLVPKAKSPHDLWERDS
jgi:hypothetical protein